MKALLRPAMTALALGFLVWLGWTARDALQAVAWTDPRVLASLAGLVLVWVAAQSLAGVAWWALLDRCIPVGRATAILLTTQIGKYLPGNVGQFVGRAWLARRHGVPLSRSGPAIAAEGLLSIGVALAVALLLLLADPGGTAPLQAFLPGPALLALLTAAVLGGLGLLLFFPGLLLRALPPASALRRVVPPPLPAGNLALATGLHGALFVLLGAALWAASPVFSDVPLPVTVTIAVFGIANVAGFVTPGAPGGLGVREAVIVAGLAPYGSADTAIALALTFRAATLLGDVAIFAIGGLSLPRPPEPDAGRETAPDAARGP